MGGVDGMGGEEVGWGENMDWDKGEKIRSEVNIVMGVVVWFVGE